MQGLVRELLEMNDPFSDLSEEGGAALALFAAHLTFWMGNVNKFSIRELRKMWSKNPELKTWLKKHVNRGVGEIYYGAQSKDLPEVGSSFKRPGRGVHHWSKDLSRSRKFAQFAGHGDTWYVLVARPRPAQVIVDVDAFSTLAGRHRESFKALMTYPDPVGMFTGEQYEAEVLTIPLSAKVLEVSVGS